jgi:tricarballylate dehydrogenase
VRGTPYNMGRVLEVLLQKGAKQVSDAKQGHCVAIDARSPKYDGGIVTRVDAVSLGIVVNSTAQRFYDEGEDFWPKRYAIWGRLVAGQPDQIGYSIIDHKSMGKFMPPVFPPFKARSIASSPARSSSIPRRSRRRSPASTPRCARHLRPHVSTIARPRGSSRPRPTGRDDRHAPFYAYPLRPGITFTYLGVAIDEQRAHADGRRKPRDERPRRRRDHGGQRARTGLSSPASAWRSGRPSGASRARRPHAMSAA